MTDCHAQIEAGARDTAYARGCPPTPDQARAGNYKMSPVLMIQGLRLRIENPRNSYREGISKDGVAWRTRIAAHYGHFVGYRPAADGDGLDVFLGPSPESPRVFIINQVDVDTRRFDEHKVMLGFTDADAAETAYRHSYARGWRGLGSMVECTVDALKWLLKHGNMRKAVTAEYLARQEDDKMQVWDSAANPVGNDLAGLMYEIRSEDDAEGLLLDAVTMDDIMHGATEMALDALVVPYAKLERQMGIMLKVLRNAGASITPVAVQITKPFRQRSTTHVAAIFELSDGQTISVFFHNPDTTPNKVMMTDEMVSWKWMLNKKDITIVVAPERGDDLNVREVARRILKLAEKNSARFQKANADRASRLASIESKKAEIAAKEGTLNALLSRIDELEDRLANNTLPVNPSAPASLDYDGTPSVGDVVGVAPTVPGAPATLEPPANNDVTQTTTVADVPVAPAVVQPQEELASHPSDAFVSTLAGALTTHGWVTDGIRIRSSNAIAPVFTKMFPTAIGEKQAAAYIADYGSDSLNYVIQGDYQSEGRNILGMELIPKTADAAAIHAAAAIFSAGVDKTVAESYAGGLLARNAPSAAASNLVSHVQLQTDPEPQAVPATQTEPMMTVVSTPFPEGAAPGGDTEMAQQAAQTGGDTQSQVEQRGGSTEATPAPVLGEAAEAARRFLTEVIDRKVDFLDLELGDKLAAIYDQFKDDQAIVSAFNAAAAVYADVMMDKARAALK